MLVAPQAKLQQQLHNASATEQLLQGELTTNKEQLQQAQATVQEVTAAAQASAAAAKAMHEAEMDKLRQHLGSEGSAQVRRLSGSKWVMRDDPVNLYTIASTF